jgi:hypothetical protein
VNADAPHKEDRFDYRNLDRQGFRARGRPKGKASGNDMAVLRPDGEEFSEDPRVRIRSPYTRCRSRLGKPMRASGSNWSSLAIIGAGLFAFDPGRLLSKTSKERFHAGPRTQLSANLSEHALDDVVQCDHGRVQLVYGRNSRLEKQDRCRVYGSIPGEHLSAYDRNCGLAHEARSGPSATSGVVLRARTNLTARSPT